MINFYDYVYYASCQFYKKYDGDKDGFRFSGLLIIALTQEMNLLTIFFTTNIVFHNKFINNKFFIVAITILLLLINGVRYSKITYDILDKKWGSEDKRKKDKKRQFVLIYVVFSVILSFGLAIYLGSKKW